MTPTLCVATLRDLTLVAVLLDIRVMVKLAQVRIRIELDVCLYPSVVMVNKSIIHHLFSLSDFDECGSSDTNDCDSRAKCNNTEGSYACRCLEGYQGDGKNCSGK